MCYSNAFSQTKGGLENYHSISEKEHYQWMPVAHYAGKKGFYVEGRYNYEDINTASVYAGKTFTGGNVFTYMATPMAGIVFGKYKGVSAAMNFDLSYRHLFFSGQFQYTFNYSAAADNFFYNWSELAYQLAKNIYGGVSIQQTKLYKDRLITSKGLLIGIETKRFTVPVYLFNPFSNERNLVVGLNMEWKK